jgi:hypothetical protein
VGLNIAVAVGKMATLRTFCKARRRCCPLRFSGNQNRSSSDITLLSDVLCKSHLSAILPGKWQSLLFKPGASEPSQRGAPNKAQAIARNQLFPGHLLAFPGHLLADFGKRRSHGRTPQLVAAVFFFTQSLLFTRDTLLRQRWHTNWKEYLLGKLRRSLTSEQEN